MNKPNVYLVGAGPGDAGLITKRGYELVQAADVLVYDQLGTGEFLQLAKQDCELFDVGKFSGNHKVTQDEINALLLRKARENKLVVRLKGGDPFVFGRGGEEMLYLAEHGVASEVVPGVTSAVSAPAYAGIPITQRGYTASLAIVTGHEAEKESSDIDWPALAKIGTVVFLMGVKNLPLICKSLIDQGRSPDTPVAMVQNATFATQKTVCGTLANMVEVAKAGGITTPAVTIVGEVVALREKLHWFEKRPLFGKTLVVTRAQPQAGALAGRLRELGARVIECPTIKIMQHGVSDELRRFIEQSATWQYLVFTSANGVEGLVSALLQCGHDLRLLAGKKLVCIGPATAEALIKRGIMPDFVPDTYVAEALLPYFAKLPAAKVALLRAKVAREVLPAALGKMGHQVEVIPIYHTEPVAAADSEAIAALTAGKVDLVTFTSASTVAGFARLVADSSINAGQVPAAAIGPITAQACEEQGYQLKVTADEFTVPGLTKAVCKYFTASAEEK